MVDMTATRDDLERLEVDRLSLALNELQTALPYTVGPYFGEALAAATRKLAPELSGPKLDKYDTRLNMLRSQGVLDLGAVLDSRQIADIRAYFDARPCFAAHIAAKSDGRE